MDDKKKFFTSKIVKWGQRNFRDFIWRRKRSDFFTVFLAEFLLRKTRSMSVNNFLEDFLKKYGSFGDLNAVPLESLKDELRVLGLQNERAKALKEIARYASNKTALTFEDIIGLPHCGRYMANAIDCFYWGKRRAIVDNNVQRVFNRYFSIPMAVEIHKAEYLWQFALELLPPKTYVEYNYHLLDFSAIVCKPRTPASDLCPIKSRCDLTNSMR